MPGIPRSSTQINMLMLSILFRERISIGRTVVAAGSICQENRFINLNFETFIYTHIIDEHSLSLEVIDYFGHNQM